MNSPRFKALHLDVARENRTAGWRRLALGHELVRVTNVLFQFGEGLALAENSRNLLQPPDIPLFVPPVFEREGVHPVIIAPKRGPNQRLRGLDETIAERAGALGRRYLTSHPGIDVADLILAALTQQLEAELKTTNVKHFPMFKGLKPPY